ncbi:hypothetical protein ACLB1O_07300 [Escherichia coli]
MSDAARAPYPTYGSLSLAGLIRREQLHQAHCQCRYAVRVPYLTYGSLSLVGRIRRE